VNDNAPLGLERGTVRVVPYDERWVRLFEEAADELRSALRSLISEVHHVGSTAVPGLDAKPILDILVTIADFERGRELIPMLAELRYEYRPDEEIPDRHYFRRRSGITRTHHLSLAEPSSHHHRVTIAFRDALRRDEALARDYGALKRNLAACFPHDRQSYIEGKTEFVRRVLGELDLAP
jgi:GrpB-like predicted nucleotidyltransferase (UPF0157 family)